MNLFDRLKTIFKINKIKQLPESTNTDLNNNLNSLQETRNKFLSEYTVTSLEPSLDDCIIEFIKKYENLSKLPEINKNDLPYKSFTSLFCNNEEPVKSNTKPIEDNIKNQNKLMNLINKTNKFSLTTQYSKNKLAFIHIQGNIGVDDNKKETEKIYINCDRAYISAIAKEVFNKIQDIAKDELQMKFIAEQIDNTGKNIEDKNTIKNYQRNDKIVIYSPNHEMTKRITQKINEIKNEKPELFSSKKIIPIMPKEYGFIGVSKKSIYDYAKTPIDHATGKTYNDFIANIMYQSILAGFDKKLGNNYKQKFSNNQQRMEKYASLFINSEKPNKLNEQENLDEQVKLEIIYNCKNIFENVCRENNVNTIYTPIKNVQKEYNKDSFER